MRRRVGYDPQDAWDVEFEEDVECSSCGYLDKDSPILGWGGSDRTLLAEWECPNCGVTQELEWEIIPDWDENGPAGYWLDRK